MLEIYSKLSQLLLQNPGILIHFFGYSPHKKKFTLQNIFSDAFLKIYYYVQNLAVTFHFWKMSDQRLSKFSIISLIFGFNFLYEPIMILIVYSFNDSQLASAWSVFSFKSYFES